jgi:hypothetical protein
MKHLRSLLTVTLLVVLPGLLAGCDSNDNGAADDFNIVGTWALTSLEGAPGPVDASNSTWTFRSDGTYSWFFLFDPIFDLDGSGNYSLQETTLTVDGVVAQTVISQSPNGTIPLTLGDNRFSFLDDDGDRWTYVKQE